MRRPVLGSMSGWREDAAALGLGVLEVAEQHVGVGDVEVPAGVFGLGLAEDVAVGERDRRVGVVERHQVAVVEAEHVHREALEAVGELARDRAAVVAADLLEVGELRHLHAVAPDLPAEAPGAERRALPVVLDEADVVEVHVDADRGEGAEVDVLQVGRRGFDDDLVLVVVLPAVRAVAVAAVGRAARRLDIGRRPGRGPERAQRRRRVEGAGADLHVVGLQDGAALGRPVGLQAQDDLLEALRGVGGMAAIRCGSAGVYAAVGRGQSRRAGRPDQPRQKPAVKRT